jgi:hypothetical protein
VREAIQISRVNAVSMNSSYCANCVCFACDKSCKNCLEWYSHCHASTSSFDWRAKRLALTGKAYPPVIAAAGAKAVAGKPAKAPPKPKKPKKVKPPGLQAEIITWFGEPYAAALFSHLIGHPFGEEIYKYLAAMEKPNKDSKMSVLRGLIVIERKDIPGDIFNRVFNCMLLLLDCYRYSYY